MSMVGLMGVERGSEDTGNTCVPCVAAVVQLCDATRKATVGLVASFAFSTRVVIGLAIAASISGASRGPIITGSHYASTSAWHAD